MIDAITEIKTIRPSKIGIDIVEDKIKICIGENGNYEIKFNEKDIKGLSDKIFEDLKKEGLIL